MNANEHKSGSDGRARHSVRAVGEMLEHGAHGVTRPTTTAAANWNRWLTVCVFAIAMAWAESAVVFDLRTMVDRIEPYQPDPLPLVGKLGPVELVREFATMIMLLTAGILAGKSWRERLGYAVIAFGVWDIFYYVFLKVICGWPHSLLDWDLLFLLPLPWWGPVLAPVLIAVLMIAWGTLVTQIEREPVSRVTTLIIWAMNFTGIFLALYAFMADTLRVASQGVFAVRKVLPTEFNWPLFLVALALMSAPVVQILMGRRRREESLTETRKSESGKAETSDLTPSTS